MLLGYQTEQDGQLQIAQSLDFGSSLVHVGK
jgi:hypothetical protein